MHQTKSSQGHLLLNQGNDCRLTYQSSTRTSILISFKTVVHCMRGEVLRETQNPPPDYESYQNIEIQHYKNIEVVLTHNSIHQ